jgi:hypothetical protein
MGRGRISTQLIFSHLQGTEKSCMSKKTEEVGAEDRRYV